MARVTVQGADGEDFDLFPGSFRLLSELDSCDLLVEVAVPATVTLDGEPVPVFRRAGRGLAFARVSGGAHGVRRVEVLEGAVPARIDVLVREAEETAEELLEMVRAAERLPRFRGQFWYLDEFGAPRRAVDPDRVATFVIDNAARITAIVRELESNPASMHETIRRTVPAGHPVNVTATVALVAREPGLLQETPPDLTEFVGPVAPLMFVIDSHRSTMNTWENRRLVAFIERLNRDAASVERAAKVVRAPLTRARHKLAALLHTTFLAGVESAGVDDPLKFEPTERELTDDRYAELFRLRVRYLRDVAPGRLDPALERQFLAKREDIFQAFCCYLVADAFGLESVGETLADQSASGACFQSGEWELVYNQAGHVPSWRDSSSRPDDYRPDILLRRRDDYKRVILIDAKYTVTSPTEVPGSQLKEVQAYLNSFEVDRIGVLFPGPLEAAGGVDYGDVAGSRFLIREVPVRSNSTETETVAKLRVALLSLECVTS